VARIVMTVSLVFSACGPRPVETERPHGEAPRRAYASVAPFGTPWPPQSNEREGWLSGDQSSFRFSEVSEHSFAIEKGCAFAPTPMPTCSGDIDAITSYDAWERRAETDGHVVTLIGPLMQDAGSGYDQPKIGSRICAVLVLGEETTGGVFLGPAPWRWDGGEPTPFWCCGDLSGLCCGVSKPITVVARGVYHSGDLSVGIHPTLGDPLFCAVHPGAMRLLRPPQGGRP
jgi:hypothetical protein